MFSLRSHGVAPTVFPLCSHGVLAVFPLCFHWVPTAFPRRFPTVFPRCSRGVFAAFPARSQCASKGFPVVAPCLLCFAVRFTEPNNVCGCSTTGSFPSPRGHVTPVRTAKTSVWEKRQRSGSVQGGRTNSMILHPVAAQRRRRKRRDCSCVSLDTGANWRSSSDSGDSHPPAQLNGADGSASSSKYDSWEM